MIVCPVLAAASKNKGVALRVALMASAALLAIEFPALAQDTTWLAAPSSSYYSDSANWSGGTVPTGSATFGASDVTALRFSSGVSVGSWTFEAGAADYAFSSSQPLQFNGAGIIVNGGSATINNGYTLYFHDSSTAGDAFINNHNTFQFYDDSTAGSAIVTNQKNMLFGGGRPLAVKSQEVVHPVRG